MDEKLKALAVGLLVILIGYNLYTGATIQKIGIPGLFEIEFGQDNSGSSTGSQPSSPVSPPTTEPSEPNPPQPAQEASVLGNWSGSVGDLELTVTKVEAVRRIGDRSILRFYITVNNRYADSVVLPLFGSFLAVDNSGGSYEADLQLSDWPQDFPAGMSIAGSIELEDPVPQDATSITISFSNIFGFSAASGRSVTVADISTP